MHLLFVCSGNTCRSPMAKYVTKSRLTERGLPWTVDSAGLYASLGNPMTPQATNALIRNHIVIDTHASKSVTDNLIAQADIILVMTSAHREDLLTRYPEAAGKVRQLSEFSRGASPAEGRVDIVDPFGGSDETYEMCCAQLTAWIDALLDALEASQ